MVTTAYAYAACTCGRLIAAYTWTPHADRSFGGWLHIEATLDGAGPVEHHPAAPVGKLGITDAGRMLLGSGPP